MKAPRPNLLSALLDNHIHYAFEPALDTRRVTWRRVMDMNDRALRDIVVGLDGYKVESEPQYDYIRAQTTDPKMDFIVWRQNIYVEVHATVPYRKFHVDLDTYKP